MLFLSGTVMGNGNDPEWQLDKGEGERSYKKRVTFKRPFALQPLVHIGVVGYDSGDGARFYAGVEKIDAEGFDVEMKTWGGARVWSITVNWLAIGQ